ncbi:Histidine kinase- DNA gyrase B- and HSP90-like ATPase [Carpediemonas membranifera]|uniref:Histidine kinase- DNA gyrase B- and HSP90-like ATPase n=1 Tax=Carpediemonas membranifera TaxID=201153 RepID=A0A8J6B9X4_9EUKA|nr:Histidine kinase- DNA gyrase B- and HSP90-like ATPase [Carpediemonas membranifera]|eukprot:KAG9397219.1 Histidine kinase- DNA gyrase B- and HSP90-like ATPase [Carpediemonas membranifera]
MVNLMDDLQRVNTLFQQMDAFSQSTWWIRDRMVWDADGSITTSDGKPWGTLLHITQSCRSLFGYSSEMLMAHPNLWMNAIAKEELKEMKQSVDEFNELCMSHDPCRASAVVFHKLVLPDNQVKYGRFQRKPVFNSRGEVSRVAGVVSDVTFFITRQKQLAEYEGKLKAIMDHIEAYVFLVDVSAEGKPTILFVSKFVETLTGYEGRQIMEDTGFWSRVLVHPDDRAMVQVEGEELMSHSHMNEQRQQSYRIVTANGEVKNILVNVNKTPGDEDTMFLLGIAYDCKDKELMEQQAHEAQRMEILGMLADGIASDFTQILRVIIGNAKKILNATDDGAGANAELNLLLNEVIDSAWLITSFTDQLRAYSGKGTMTMTAVSLTSMLRKMKQFMETPSNITATWELVEEGTLPLVRGDEVRLSQVVQNLFTNSVEAIGRCEGTITVSTGTMLDASGHPERVFVRITDTGCGMDSAIMDRLFEPMFSTKFTGRGLGMAAVKGIVDAHGGSIDVESEVGAGTTFTVFFPVDSQ